MRPKRGLGIHPGWNASLSYGATHSQIDSHLETISFSQSMGFLGGRRTLENQEKHRENMINSTQTADGQRRQTEHRFEGE